MPDPLVIRELQPSERLSTREAENASLWGDKGE